MQYRLLGDTGVWVSALCMGTMTFGREADRETSAALFKRCRDAGINFRVPLMVVHLLKDEKVTWPFVTEPQKHLNDRTQLWVRGRVLGGCSSINGNVYVRGDPAETRPFSDRGERRVARRRRDGARGGRRVASVTGRGPRPRPRVPTQQGQWQRLHLAELVAAKQGSATKALASDRPRSPSVSNAVFVPNEPTQRAAPAYPAPAHGTPWSTRRLACASTPS